MGYRIVIEEQWTANEAGRTGDNVREETKEAEDEKEKGEINNVQICRCADVKM